MKESRLKEFCKGLTITIGSFIVSYLFMVLISVIYGFITTLDMLNIWEGPLAVILALFGIVPLAVVSIAVPTFVTFVFLYTICDA